ncbi:hypothetical protein VE02_08127 [Pseudogymnoascus sp. 03VT05]|nr:hypothetical protein VE02_08127 [Pseudogymnoascus sp. 03VT05]
MPKACRFCWGCTSPSTPGINNLQGVPYVKAVFSDNWKWSFNSKDRRSRRRRFVDSGEIISGFTAVFSEDWKDEESDKAHPRVRPLSCNTCKWDKGPEKKRDADAFLTDSPSTWPPFKRQREEDCNLSRTETIFSTTSPNLQQYEFGESQSNNWPPSPTSANTVTPSSMTPNNEETSLPELISSECFTPNIPSSVYSMTTDMSSPAADEFEHLPWILAAEATNAHDDSRLLSKPLPGYHRSLLEDKRMAEDLGFNYWEEFIDYNIMAEGVSRLDGFQEWGSGDQFLI